MEEQGAPSPPHLWCLLAWGGFVERVAVAVVREEYLRHFCPVRALKDLPYLVCPKRGVLEKFRSHWAFHRLHYNVQYKVPEHRNFLLGGPDVLKAIQSPPFLILSDMRNRPFQDKFFPESAYQELSVKDQTR